MTRPDDAESVKLLREFVQRIANADAHEFASDYRNRANKVLAATAPPKPYAIGQCVDEVVHDGWVVLRFGRMTNDAKRQCVLDALNALAEKEASR